MLRRRSVLRIGEGGGRDNGAKIERIYDKVSYVYLLTSSILYRNTVVLLDKITATLAQWGERLPSERTGQILIPVRPDKTYTVFC